MPSPAERVEELLGTFSHEEMLDLHVELLRRFTKALAARPDRVFRTVEAETRSILDEHGVPYPTLQTLAAKLLAAGQQAALRSFPGYRFDEVDSPTLRALRNLPDDDLAGEG